MGALGLLAYLFGGRSAILEATRWRGAFGVGIFLTVLTAVARHYDQTFIGEGPWLWFLGPLLFSFVSGSWLYIVVYGWFGRRSQSREEGAEPTPFLSAWRPFMGVFWLTAPIAWLYALPVERYFDSVTAAKLNIALLAVVSIWRVLLMARVMQVVIGARFVMALLWVLFAAGMEVGLVFLSSGTIAKMIMSAMGGMRNSPEEEILMTAMTTVFNMMVWIVPISLIAALAWREGRTLRAFPDSRAGALPWPTLAVLTLLWTAAAIQPQRELANSVALEQLFSEGKTRAALDFLGRHQVADFAPARALPPRPYERTIFDQLPACFAELRPSDPLWVQRHLVSRLDQMISHYRHTWYRHRTPPNWTEEEVIQDMADGLQWQRTEADAFLHILDGLARIPAGPEWLRANSVFIEALRRTAREGNTTESPRSKTREEQEAAWRTLLKRLEVVSPTAPQP